MNQEASTTSFSTGIRRRGVAINQTGSDSEGEEQDLTDILNGQSYLDSAGLDWSDFNVDFHSSVPSVKTPFFKDLASKRGASEVDLRPFMISRPYTVFENDSI